MYSLYFHHIGIATKNLYYDLDVYLSIGYSKKSEIFVDENQSIRGLFIEARGFPTLELLENLDEHGPLDSFLSRGIKIYHMAYATNHIERDMQMIVDKFNARIIKPIMAATYFAYVGFIMLPNQSLIEFVQEKR